MKKTIVQHVVKEILGKGNLKNYEEIISPRVEVHCPPSWQEVHAPHLIGQDKTRKIDEAYIHAFQFHEMHIHEMLAEKNKVVVRWSGRGFNGGSFFYLPATHKPFEISGHTIYRLENRQIVEVWQAWDMLAVLRQLKGPFKSNHELQKMADRLTLREKECLQLLLMGKTAIETAQELHLSKRTVEYYFENIKDKLQCEKKRDVLRKGLIFQQFNVL